MRFSTAICFALAGLAQAQTSLTSAFKPPTLTFLYSCNVSMSLFLKIGQGEGNTTRAIFPISGGEFGGPRVQGKVLALGGDWLDYDGVNYFISDSRSHLRTDDGADIYVQMSGKTVPDGVVHIHASFQTPVKKYAWMNDLKGVGMLIPTRFGYTVDLYHLQTPNFWTPRLMETYKHRFEGIPEMARG